MATIATQLNSGTGFSSGETVTASKLNNLVNTATVTGIVNADIDAGAGIAHNKLANITAGQVLLGNASNAPTATALTGDVTVTSAGVTAIGSAKVLPAMMSQPFTLMSAQNSTSGTSVSFTGIPSWAKRITLMLNGVSTNGGSHLLVQVGTGSTATTSGYVGGQSIFSWVASSVTGVTGSGNGIPIFWNSTVYVYYGTMTLCNAGGNLWVASGTFVNSGGLQSTIASGGAITLGGALGMIRIITANGTDTFDAGTVNVSYE